MLRAAQEITSKEDAATSRPATAASEQAPSIHEGEWQGEQTKVSRREAAMQLLPERQAGVALGLPR